MSVAPDVTSFDETRVTNDWTDGASQEEHGVVSQAARFVRENIWKLLAISAVMLIPLFWHRHIVQCDLGSHVYNAWLATLIAKGQAPGLYFIRQWHNILFDNILTWLGMLVGWGAAEKIALCLSVSIFFWGAFAMMSAVASRPAWFLLPALAMISYGWTLEIGFSNYYLSLGLGFWAVALFWRGRGRELWLFFALLPLIMLAHVFGFIFAVGVAAYTAARKRLPIYLRFLPLAGAAATIFLARRYLGHHYPVRWLSALPISFINGLNGVDQIVLGPQYQTLARSVFLLGVGCILYDWIQRRSREHSWKSLAAFAVPIELYGVVLLAIASLPDAIKFPQYTAWISFILMRFSSIAAVLALCILACMAPRKWHLVLFTATAVLFFALLYRDTGVLSGMQEQADKLVSQLPPGRRVAATIFALPDSRFYFIGRIVDRACVAHCFNYDNYEPASAAFRIGALPGNPIVSASYHEVQMMEHGVYTVQPSDLPLYAIYQCNSSFTTLCMRPFHAGEMLLPKAVESAKPSPAPQLPSTK